MFRNVTRVFKMSSSIFAGKKVAILGFSILFVWASAVNLGKFLCSPGFCSSVKCEAIEDCQNGKIIQNASFCNCCDACIKFIESDQLCKEVFPGSLKEIGQSECQIGFNCLNGKCVLDESKKSCFFIRKVRLLRKGKDDYAENLWAPKCDIQGHYEAKQHKKNKNFCFGQSGNRLFGYEERDASEPMACRCSHHINELKKLNAEKFMTEPQEHCTISGNFERLQCITELCYCANYLTGEVLGKIVAKRHIDKLPCYDEKTSSKDYLKPCEKELQRQRLLRYQFFQKGINIVSEDGLRCDPDGNYSPRQCDEERCVCTDRLGVGIRSYYIQIDEYRKLLTEMKCNCARDLISATSHMQFSRFKCKGFGNYDLLQCFDESECFCIDEDGDITSKPIKKKDLNETVCLEMLEQLNTLYDESTTSSTHTLDETSTTDDYDYSNYDEYD
ncbi:uncharacterized protein LOC129218820 [Uloborus diversus]|uniref:uncharacterized protein LOC129218820 n=1 Tax=Uloborus diversus TaxID=327109 RepID=UPI00240A2820|nr:uncharacterized protein LOC129218820 [Uloborus diversus]